VDKLVVALGPAFAAGLAIQQFLEISDPIVSKLLQQDYKKLVLNALALAVGLALAFGAGLQVLKPLGIENHHTIDSIATGLIISGGTQGINSILKFMGYAKEGKKAEAVEKTQDAKKKEALAEGKQA
jgi:hypothetical protein